MQRYLEEEKKRQKVSIDTKKIGDNYLEIAKRMRRSESYQREVKTDKEDEH